MTDESSGSPPPWAQDISRALASARQASPERRLVVFLAALSTETLRLAGSESGESGEALAFTTICLRGLFADSSVTPSEDELDSWTLRVHVMLILESLQRRGYVRVDYGAGALDPLASDAGIQIIGTWAEAVRSQRTQLKSLLPPCLLTVPSRVHCSKCWNGRSSVQSII